MMVVAIRGTQINQYLSIPELWGDEARIFSVADHSIDRSYIPALEALACAKTQQTEVVS